MQRPPIDQPTDGLQSDPSTRRDTLGSPASPSGSADEPNFSSTPSSSSTDAIFDALKARISRLWDEEPSADDIRSALSDRSPT